jgi:hypothetical protein
MILAENINIEGFNYMMNIENIQAGNYQIILKGEKLHLVETLIIK